MEIGNILDNIDIITQAVHTYLNVRDGNGLDPTPLQQDHAPMKTIEGINDGGDRYMTITINVVC